MISEIGSESRQALHGLQLWTAPNSQGKLEQWEFLRPQYIIQSNPTPPLYNESFPVNPFSIIIIAMLKVSSSKVPVCALKAKRRQAQGVTNTTYNNISDRYQSVTVVVVDSRTKIDFALVKILFN
jgi:hypothetical protein